ncbi:fungal-specific transcription factor domain-domain-containing protein [Clohesyomyces aquaticus]|uniref:Fungal-specific transcription factor domain-domain-containing protein n=1 Tax=Clohesyomyces aquaticus TaxID=1231657 RepID=A0A1Y2A1Q8_9PLEO|nr:fungal-specific transcription factor domain-domain-containing protein [Clohesyomyces aquaticus]
MPNSSPAVPAPIKSNRRRKPFLVAGPVARRIKCDEGRPACERCSRSRLSYEGYGVRLLWMNSPRHRRTCIPDTSLHQTQGQSSSSIHHSGNGPRDVGSTISKRSEMTVPSSFSSTAPKSIPEFSNQIPCHIDDLTVSSRQKSLIQLWVFFLCKSMVPVDLVHNPYRVVCLSFAFDGLDSSVTRSNNLAVFHGMCAVSAENLIYLGNARRGVSKILATHHNHLALKHLQRALETQLPINDIAPVLSAILICILRDSITGEARNWRYHVQGALSCIPKPMEIGAVQPGSSLHVVLEHFLCLAVFGNITTTYDLGALIDHFPVSGSYMSQYHGISKFTLQPVLLINRYSANASGQRSVEAYNGQDRQCNSSHFMDLELLELKAYLHAPTAIPPEIHPRHEDAVISFHYSHVYYFALLIYLQ